MRNLQKLDIFGNFTSDKMENVYCICNSSQKYGKKAVI